MGFLRRVCCVNGPQYDKTTYALKSTQQQTWTERKGPFCDEARYHDLMETLPENQKNVLSETIEKLDKHNREHVLLEGSWAWILFSKLLWLLWKLPCMFSADLGRLGPGFGVGVGFGFGIGFGLIGGAGFGFGVPGMQFGLGFGAGFGVGMGFGYGLGKGCAFDENGEHCNLPGLNVTRDKRSSGSWDQLYPANHNDIPTSNKEEGGAMWDQFLHNSKLAFDSVEKSYKTKKQS
ncbi:hypothetical protein GOP47_0015549 [Adiantum capillus-veneris]|uniref:Uncharacterized protein n=1 Tax=Adiantum capillus-veneris TaxID=13818 RepID=A0A9D4ZBC1_ADICA|nr:hypothetical protein GOP47_0015549 [Adiantum capillus-veneris]